MTADEYKEMHEKTWCHGNRTHKNDKRELAAEQELREYDD